MFKKKLEKTFTNLWINSSEISYFLFFMVYLITVYYII